MKMRKKEGFMRCRKMQDVLLKRGYILLILGVLLGVMIAGNVESHSGFASIDASSEVQINRGNKCPTDKFVTRLVNTDTDSYVEAYKCSYYKFSDGHRVLWDSQENEENWGVYCGDNYAVIGVGDNGVYCREMKVSEGNAVKHGSAFERSMFNVGSSQWVVTRRDEQNDVWFSESISVQFNIVKVFVKNNAGSGISGVRVNIIGSDGNSNVQNTNASGHSLFPLLIGTNSYEASKTGYATLTNSFPVMSGTNSLTLTLNVGCVDEDLDSITGANAIIYDEKFTPSSASKVGSQTLNDTCLSSNVLNEAYCLNNNPAYAGSTCDGNKVCLTNANRKSYCGDAPAQCDDSDKGPANLTTSGSASKTGSTTQYDQCDPANQNKIFEALCNSAGNPALPSTSVNCPSSAPYCHNYASSTIGDACEIQCDNDHDRYHSNTYTADQCLNKCGSTGTLTCDGRADCDDNNGTIYPGSTEICNDGKDNDCNNVIDTWGGWSTCTSSACTPTACSSCTGSQSRTDSCSNTQNQVCTIGATGCPTGKACNANNQCVAVSCDNNGVKNSSEQCDGPDFGSTNSQGLCSVYNTQYASGNLGCNNCVVNTSACVSADATCGNGAIDTGEICDPNGPIFKDYGDGIGKCENHNPDFISGNLNCTTSCQILEDDCRTNANEVCDSFSNCEAITSSNQCGDCSVIVGQKDPSWDFSDFNPRCEWSSGTCKFKADNPTSGKICTYETLSYSCLAGETETSLTTKINGDADSGCCSDEKTTCTETKRVPCPKIVELPFFSLFNFVSSFIVISGIYAFMLRRVRKE